MKQMVALALGAAMLVSCSVQRDEQATLSVTPATTKAAETVSIDVTGMT